MKKLFLSLLFLLSDNSGAGKIFSDIYNEVARHTGDTTTSHVTYVKKHINDALREISSQMSYSWLKRTASLTLTAGIQAYTISDFASDWDEDTPVDIWYRDSANQRTALNVYDDEEWYDEEDIDEADPYGFNISSKEAGVWKVYLVYVPTSAFVSSYSPLKFDYFKYPTELSADGDVPELPTSAHQALIYKASELVSAEMGDDEGVTRWGRLAAQSLGLLKKRQVHRLGRSKRCYPRDYLSVNKAAKRKDYNL